MSTGPSARTFPGSRPSGRTGQDRRVFGRVVGVGAAVLVSRGGGTVAARSRSSRPPPARTPREDQAGHVLQAGGCLGDHGASVGMPDQHDRAVDGLDHVADDAGVEATARNGFGGVSAVWPALCARGSLRRPWIVGEGAVDEDDGGIRHRVLPGLEPWPQRRYVTGPERVGPGVRRLGPNRLVCAAEPSWTTTCKWYVAGRRLRTGSSAWPATSDEIADRECAC